MSIFNLAGPVHSQNKAQAKQEAPQEEITVVDEPIVAEEIEEPVKAPKKSKAKKKKED